jgi:hypothetical protein
MEAVGTRRCRQATCSGKQELRDNNPFKISVVKINFFSNLMTDISFSVCIQTLFHSIHSKRNMNFIFSCLMLINDTSMLHPSVFHMAGDELPVT